jgi:hypothetical protein
MPLMNSGPILSSNPPNNLSGFPPDPPPLRAKSINEVMKAIEADNADMKDDRSAPFSRAGIVRDA